MRRNQPSPAHAEAVQRRLATLSAELAAVRQEAPATDDTGSSAEAPAPVDAPVPGRHASRRNEGTSRLSLTRPSLARLGLDRIGPWHVAAVMTLVAVAVGVAAWLSVRSQAEPAASGELRPAAEPLMSVESPGPGAGSPGATPSQPAEELTVDVAGKVRSPGIAVLPSGSRVVDALEAAGGAKRGVDLTSLNLARLLVDGEQILVGVSPPPGVPGTVTSPDSAQPSGALVNINTADQTVLETLPGVGPVTAQAIITWRTDNGGFSAVEELIEVSGIGEATMAKLAPLVTV